MPSSQGCRVNVGSASSMQGVEQVRHRQIHLVPGPFWRPGEALTVTQEAGVRPAWGDRDKRTDSGENWRSPCRMWRGERQQSHPGFCQSHRGDVAGPVSWGSLGAAWSWAEPAHGPAG